MARATKKTTAKKTTTTARHKGAEEVVKTVSSVVEDQDATHIGLILDRSSSMEAVLPDTITAFNNYFDQLQNQAPNALVTVWLFSSEGFTFLCNDLSPEKVPRLSRINYKPYGNTPLYDAVGKIIQHMSNFGNKVQLVIQTDGQENCSKEFNLASIRKLIDLKQQSGWSFIFLGAGLNAYEISKPMGIFGSSTVAYAAGSESAVTRGLASASADYTRSGNFAGFTAEQKGSFGDAFATSDDVAPPTSQFSQSEGSHSIQGASGGDGSSGDSSGGGE